MKVKNFFGAMQQFSEIQEKPKENKGLPMRDWPFPNVGNSLAPGLRRVPAWPRLLWRTTQGAEPGQAGATGAFHGNGPWAIHSIRMFPPFATCRWRQPQPLQAEGPRAAARLTGVVHVQGG